MWAGNTSRGTKPHDQSHAPTSVFASFCTHACSPFLHFASLASSGVRDLRRCQTDAKMPPLRRQQYSAAFKRQAILYAESESNVEAGRKFDVSEKCVREWRKQRTKIFACAATRRSFRGPKSGRYPAVEEAVRDWVHDHRHPFRRRAAAVAHTMAMTVTASFSQATTSRKQCFTGK